MKNRKSWEEYYLEIAKVVSTRSHDLETKHGCVITDSENRPLGFGYNGFPRGMKDSELPVTRPHKYNFMIHAEVNAILNCVHKPKNGIAYITGEPCNNCILFLWQAGINKIVYLDTHGSKLITDEAREIRKIILSHIDLEFVPFSVS